MLAKRSHHDGVQRLSGPRAKKGTWGGAVSLHDICWDEFGFNFVACYLLGQISFQFLCNFEGDDLNSKKIQKPS